MEKDSLIIMGVVIGVVVVSFILGGQSITGKAVEPDVKSYKIEAVKVKELGQYSVNGVSFSLYSGQSETILGGVTLSHETTLSGGARFELSGACKNAYTVSATYQGVDPAGEEIGEFEVRLNGKKRIPFELKEGESKVLSDGSKITLLTLHRGSFSGDNRGTEFELVCS